jgi:hypothetical protein
MEVFEGLHTNNASYNPHDSLGVLMVCLLVGGSIPLIICLVKRVNRPINKPILPVYLNDTPFVSMNPNLRPMRI